MKLTDEQILAAARATISLADGGYAVDTGTEQVIAFARTIEALAHERGRQQGLKEVLGALREYPCATYQIEGMFAAIEAVKEHAAKGPK